MRLAVRFPAKLDGVPQSEKGLLQRLNSVRRSLKHVGAVHIAILRQRVSAESIQFRGEMGHGSTLHRLAEKVTERITERVSPLSVWSVRDNALGGSKPLRPTKPGDRGSPRTGFPLSSVKTRYRTGTMTSKVRPSFGVFNSFATGRSISNLPYRHRVIHMTISYLPEILSGVNFIIPKNMNAGSAVGAGRATHSESSEPAMSSTTAKTLARKSKSAFMQRSIVFSAQMTVVWSRLNMRPISGMERGVRCFARYIATWRGRGNLSCPAVARHLAQGNAEVPSRRFLNFGDGDPAHRHSRLGNSAAVEQEAPPAEIFSAGEPSRG